MSRREIRPLSDKLLDGAGRLLAERHAAHRRRVPALDPRFEDAAVARAEIAGLLEREGALGLAAVDGSTVVGYLVGTGRDQVMWGPNAWIEGAGHAATEPEAVRELYAVASASWVAAGRTGHSVIVPASDELLLDAWYSLGFGRQHVHAIRESPPADFQPEIRAALIVRRAVAADNRALAELALVVPEHHAGAPVFSRAPIPSFEAALAEIEEEAFVNDPRYAAFVAEHEGRVVGEAMGCSIAESTEHSGLVRPPGTGFLGYVAVRPDARGLGAGRALGETVLAWARDAGYAMVVTDWRSTNLESNRAWVALGFRPMFHRLHRAIA